MKVWWYFPFGILALIFILFFVRLVLPSQIDDVSPGIFCDEKLLEKADIFFVIPKFGNVSIADNSEWCEYILSFEKELGLHGVYHTYEEFNGDIDLQLGIDIFEECFGFEPERFKPPQVKISDENQILVENEMKLDGKLSN